MAMTKLKTVMHRYRCSRRMARCFINSINKQKALLRAEIYRIIYVGDKPGEGTNVGTGLVNSLKEYQSDAN